MRTSAILFTVGLLALNQAPQVEACDACENQMFDCSDSTFCAVPPPPALLPRRSTSAD